MKSWIPCLLFLSALPATAQQMYKCQGPDGLSFSDRPCPSSSRQAEITVKPASTPDAERQRQLNAEQRRNAIDDTQRRANYQISEEAARSRRAAAVRQGEIECNRAREQRAYYASRPNYTVGAAGQATDMTKFYDGEIARLCN